MSEAQGARLCPACSASNELTDRFCGNCGADLRGSTGERDALRPTDPSMAVSGAVSGSGSIPALRSDESIIGRVIDGRYRVQARIGQGGMGAVYRVEHVAMGKVAAMKVLHPSLSQEAEVVRRFRREAEAVSRLSHPNTVQVFDFGEVQGSMYLVMELVRGEDLGALLKRDGPFGWKRLGPIVTQVLDALIEAHELGVIHRDIKPENLLVARTRDGRDLVKVLDFGLAKLRDVEELNKVTGRGTVLGTPYYMSPEQIRAEDLDARSDLYSLGALVYRSLTGEHPFSAATPVAVLTQHLTAVLEPPRKRAPTRGISAEAEAIVLRAMSRSPADRFQSAEDMRVAVAETLTTSSSDSLPAIDRPRRASDLSATSSAVGIAERMQREDFDSYERGLSVRKWIALSLLPFLLVVAGVGAYYLLVPPKEHAVTEEHEPNDDPAHANMLESGKPIRGQIGKRRSTEESDRDFYHLIVPKGCDRLAVQVTGIPEMDLILQVFDAQGHEVAESETGAEGDAEAIYDLRVTAGDYYVEVREVWVRGQQATENVSDWYSLDAKIDHATLDEELEPNDADSQANTIAGIVVSGRLSHPGDIDCFVSPDPHPAAIGASVSGLAGIDMRLSIHARGEIAPAHPTDKAGSYRLADRAATGAGETLEREAWPPNAQVPLVCVERKDHTPVAQTAHAEHTPHVALPSRTALYRLDLNIVSRATPLPASK